MERRWADYLWFATWVLASSAWCLTAAARLGPTFDEPIYVQRGLDGWRTFSHQGLLKLVNPVINVTAIDPEVPEQTLTYEILSGPPGPVVQLGRFRWLVPTNQPLGDYLIVLRVTDNGLPAFVHEHIDETCPKGYGAPGSDERKKINAHTVFNGVDHLIKKVRRPLKQINERKG